MSKVNVTMRATVTVEIPVGAWDENVSFGQIRDRVIHESLQIIESSLGRSCRAYIVPGGVRVDAVMAGQADG